MPVPPITAGSIRSVGCGRTHFEAMISRGQIYFAVASQLNDPFEFKIRTVYPPTEEELDIAARELCELRYTHDSIPERHYHFEETKQDLRNLHKIEVDPNYRTTGLDRKVCFGC